MKLPYHD